jgi:hypothetical protein
MALGGKYRVQSQNAPEKLKGDSAEIERKGKTTLSSCSFSGGFLNLYGIVLICGYIRGRTFAGRTSLKPRFAIQGNRGTAI